LGQRRPRLGEGGFDAGKGKGKNGKGKDGKDPFAPPAMPDPSDNLYIKGLPIDFTQEMAKEVFGAYGTVLTTKIMNFGNGSSCLIRMGNAEMATWMFENLNGNIPQGLDTPVSIRYADTPTNKAQKMQEALAVMGGGGDDEYGKAMGKKGKGGPYGGGKGVAFGNIDPNLPVDIKNAVDAACSNLGGGGKKRVAPSGDESNLYVKDLPGHADELYIYKLFSPFGPLESIHLKKGDCGTWAIAFVKFMSNEGAAKAVMGLSGCLLPDGVMPKVSVKVQKPEWQNKGAGKGEMQAME